MWNRLAARLSRNVAIALVYFLALALFIGSSIAVNGFSSSSSVKNILLLATILGLVAAGQTLVILGAGIDLSVPWVMTSAAVLTASMTDGDSSALVWVLPIVFGLAIVVGLFNGLGVAVLGISPIVMTLATNVMLSGLLTLHVQVGSPVAAPSAISDLASGELLGLPVPLFLLLGVTVLMTIVLTFTPFGRRVYAVGANVTASRFSGVNPVTVTTATYVCSAIGSAAAGLVLLGFVGRAFPGIGDEYQFSTIAAVIVGGASILGGSGHYIGTVAGVLLLTILNALLQAYSLGAGTVLIFYGVIIIVSVWIAQQDIVRLGMRRRRSQPPLEEPT
jgi:ribose transport system permease protein